MDGTEPRTGTTIDAANAVVVQPERKSRRSFMRVLAGAAVVAMTASGGSLVAAKDGNRKRNQAGQKHRDAGTKDQTDAGQVSGKEGAAKSQSLKKSGSPSITPPAPTGKELRDAEDAEPGSRSRAGIARFTVSGTVFTAQGRPVGPGIQVHVWSWSPSLGRAVYRGFVSTNSFGRYSLSVTGGPTFFFQPRFGSVWGRGSNWRTLRSVATTVTLSF